MKKEGEDSVHAEDLAGSLWQSHIFLMKDLVNRQGRQAKGITKNRKKKLWLAC